MTPSTSVIATARLRPVRSPLRMRLVAHCIVTELVSRTVVATIGDGDRVEDVVVALRREDRQRGPGVEVGREEGREEHHLAGDEEHHPQQRRCPCRRAAAS